MFFPSFENSCLIIPLQVEVVSDVKVLEKEYPCLAAVNRCANCRICFYPQLLLGAVQIIFLLLDT